MVIGSSEPRFASSVVRTWSPAVAGKPLILGRKDDIEAGAFWGVAASRLLLLLMLLLLLGSIYC